MEDDDVFGTSALFASNLEYDVLEFNFGEVNVILHTQELENQHIQPATGMLLWPASNTLCEYMITHRDLFEGKTILELGSGVGLCGIVAAHLSEKVVLTDADLDSLQLLQKNIDSNAAVKDRVESMPLAWGDADSIAKFQEKHGSQFELIIGSDLIYQSRSLDPLFSTLDKLLSPSPNACFILAFFDRNNHLPHLLTVVKKYNFQEERIEVKSFSKRNDSMAQLMLFRRKVNT